MQLAALRYVAVEGTNVSVNVTSAAEAKAALKELKHKRKEVLFLKRALQRELKSASRKAKPAPRSQYALVRWYKSAKSLAGSMRRASNAVPVRTVQVIQQDIVASDDTIFSIDSCIIQVEGKLLHLT